MNHPDTPLTPLSPKVSPEENRRFFNFHFSKTNKLKNFCNNMDTIKQLDDEITLFKSKICNNSFMKKLNFENSAEFWKTEYQSEMPKLAELYFILNNIPSTSASIERFFSIAGIVNEKRRLRMRNDLITQRTMIKANMEVLENCILSH